MNQQGFIANQGRAVSNHQMRFTGSMQHLQPLQHTTAIQQQVRDYANL